MSLSVKTVPAVVNNQSTSIPEPLEILSVFSGIPDARHSLGKRHHIALCLALFTLSIAAGNQGFLAIGNWLKSYQTELIALFNPPKQRLPSYSTIRRVLICDNANFHKGSRIESLVKQADRPAALRSERPKHSSSV